MYTFLFILDLFLEHFYPIILFCVRGVLCYVLAKKSGYSSVVACLACLGGMFLGWVIVIVCAILYLINLKKNGTSSESTSYSDIPDYFNWDRIYDSLKWIEVSENGPMTLERAIEHFRMDYAHIRNAFSNEEKLQGYEVDDYKKDILEMFDRFEDSLATNQVSLSDYGNLRFRISCKTSNGSVQYYDHFPVRHYRKYDMRMWKGYLYIHEECWVSYGLSNEHRQQYWRAFDGHYRFGMDASHGKAEETAIR